MGLRWEYKVVERAEPATVLWLNALGQEGWEVCAIEPRYDPLLGSVQAQYGRLWLFKRMVLEHPSIQAESANVTFQGYPTPAPTPVKVRWPSTDPGQVSDEEIDHLPVVMPEEEAMPDFKRATTEKSKRKWSAEAKARARQRMVTTKATTPPQEELDAPTVDQTGS